MRPAKIFSLASILLVGVFAVANTGRAAAATTLCKGSWSPLVCPMAERYPGGSEFKAPLRFAGFSEARLTAGTLVVKCTSSTLLLKTSEEAGAPLRGEITELAFGGCTGCTSVTAIHLNYATELEWTSEGHGSLTLKSAGAGNPAIKISGCPGGTTCIYKAEGLGARMGPGELTEILFENAPMAKESGGCAAAEATFFALYGIERLRETPEQAWALAPAILVEKA